MGDLFGQQESAIERSAVISDCGLFRYRLDRRIGSGKRACVVMVNPSTADGKTDDATIRKLIGFASVNAWGHITVVNKFAFRATDVKALRTAHDPEGPYNYDHQRRAMIESDIIVAAWGPLAKLPQHLREKWRIVAGIARDLKRPIYCLGTAQDGNPRHPLMLAYVTPLVEWKGPQP